MASATPTAVLNLSKHTLTIRDEADTDLATVPVVYRENESVDRWVKRQASKRGFSTTGEPFDYQNGLVYRLRKV